MRLLVALLFIFLAGAPPAHAEPPPAQIREALQEVIQQEAYQTDLRALPPPQEYKPKEESTLPSLEKSPTSEVSWSMLWVLLGVIGALVIFWLGREFLQSRRANPFIEPSITHIAPAVQDQPIPRPEALAQQGLFAEAIHALLLSALALILRKQQQEASATSREILRQSKLTDDARSAMEALVHAVEHTRFGGRPVQREDFERCLRAFQRVEGAFL